MMSRFRWRWPHISTVVVGLAGVVILGDILMLVLGIPWSGSEEYLRSLAGQVVTISGTVVEDPDTGESKTTYRLGELVLGGDASVNGMREGGGGEEDREEDGDNEGDAGREVSGAVYVSGGVNRKLKRGNRVTISGKMSGGFGTFTGTFYRPKLVRIEEGGVDVFLNTRDYFAGKIREAIPEQEAALGLGYLLGVRSSLPDGLDETLKVVGLTHIIVASGANLSILIGFSRRVLGKVSRMFGLIGSLFLVVFYVGMVGLSPSMVRAGIVSILSLAAWYVGRSFTPGRLLVIVAAATLLYNPIYIIDLGWLLSFGSFMGVMIVGPALAKFFYGEKKPGVIGATLLETIAASVICAPILLYFFGSISLISLLANLLVLPTISVAMALCFVTGLFGMVGLSAIAGIVGQVATWLLSYHLFVIDFFGAQTNFVVTIPTGQWQVFLAYVPMIIIALTARVRHGGELRLDQREQQLVCCELRE